MEGPGQIPEIVRRNRLKLVRLHGQYLDQNLSGFFYGMHQAEGQVKVFSGAEHALSLIHI